MASDVPLRNDDYVPASFGMADGTRESRIFRVDPATNRLLVDAGAISVTIPAGAATEATLVKLVPGTPVHFDGSVGTTPDTITPATETRSILIENMHATQSILISLDGGSNFKTVVPGAVFTIDCAVTEFDVKGSGAGTDYEGIYIL